MSAQPGSPQIEPQPRPMVRIVGLLWVVVIAIVVAFAYFASSLCITFLLASFLALLFDPIPTFLERFRIPRVISTGLLILAGLVGIVAAVHASYGRVNQIIDDLPDYADRIHDAFDPINQRIQQVQKSAGSITASAPVPISKKSPPVVRVADQPSPAWPSYLIRGVGSVWGALIVGGIVPFLMFFMLVRKSHLYDWTAHTFGETVDVPNFTTMLAKMVRGFVVGNLIVGALMAGVMVAVLYALKVPGALPLGIASGFLNLVPFLGAILAAGSAAVRIDIPIRFARAFCAHGCCRRCAAHRFGQFPGAEIDRLARQYWSRRGHDGDAVLGVALGNYGRAIGRAAYSVCEACR